MPIDLDVNFRPAYPGEAGPHSGWDHDRWDTKRANEDTFIFWRDYITSIALNQFKWLNMPCEIDERYIELVLLFQGFGCFFQPAPGVLMFSQATQVDMLDVYYNPQKVTLIASNGSGTWDRRCNDVVSISDDGEPFIEPANAAFGFDNRLRACMARYIELYAHRLAAIDRVCDVNVLAQTTPWVLQTDDRGKQDVLEYFKEIEGFEPAIVEYSGFNLNAQAGVLNTQAPFVGDKLTALKEAVLDDVMTMFGMENVSSKKKERMIVDEAESNDEQILVLKSNRLNCRRECARRCNDLFGTQIDVVWRTAEREPDEALLEGEVNI